MAHMMQPISWPVVVWGRQYFSQLSCLLAGFRLTPPPQASPCGRPFPCLFTVL